VVLKFVGNSSTNMRSMGRWLSTIVVGELCIYDMPQRVHKTSISCWI